MVYLIVGENGYGTARELALIVKAAKLEPEYVDTSTLTVAQLADIVRAQVLFASQRLIICRGLSENKLVWDKLAEWIGEVGDDTTLVCVEPRPDKRTKAYKIISKQARVIEATQLTDRDWRQAESWLDEYAHSHNVKLSRSQLRDMVQRAHVPDSRPGRQLIDQQILARAVEALSALPDVDDEAIAAVMPQSSEGTIFDILQYALTGERDKVNALLSQLRQQTDAQAVMPSILSQWVQLVEVTLVGEHAAQELGIHPYVAQKLGGLARSVRRDAMNRITELGAQLDADMKRSYIEPWDAVDRFVLALMIGE